MMKKLLIMILLVTPTLFLVGCGTQTPEEQAAKNLIGNGM
jgi:outer membrane lipoprotein-sorting protein